MSAPDEPLPATPRQRRPYAARVPIEERREQLLDAALAIIDRDGYAAVSIESIAKEAGVTRPVVYGAYDGLTPLLQALLERQQARAFDGLTAALAVNLLTGDIDTLVLDTVRELVARITADPVTWRPILLAPTNTPAAVADRIDADRERIRRQLEALLRLGLPLKGIRGLDPELVSHTMIAVMEHFGRLVLERPDDFTADRLADGLKPLLRALAPPRPAQ